MVAAPRANGRTQGAQPAFRYWTEIPELLQHHFEVLHVGSSISIDVIRERGYWSATDWTQLQGLGLTGNQKRPECFPALVIPHHDPSGGYTYSVPRWDRPRIGSKGREIKYDQPVGIGLRLDVPQRCVAGLRDPEQPLWW